MGTITLSSEDSGSNSILSNTFIDYYMPEANGDFVKVYLYLLRMMGAGRAASISDMADLFNHTEKEVLRSLKYWEKKGLIALLHDSTGALMSIHLCELRPRSLEQEKAPAKEEERVISITPVLDAAGKPEDAPSKAAPARSAAATRAMTRAAVKAFSEDEEKAQLLFIVEQYIGKPLSPSEMRVVYYMLEELHFSADLIDYLVQYCVGNGKKDFRYIEKVAVNWAESGITTTRQAQAAASARASRQRGKSSAPRKNSFTNYEQRQYDIDAIEKLLNEEA